MEGPSLYLAKEQLRPFQKKRVLRAFGNTKLDQTRFVDREVKDIFLRIQKEWGNIPLEVVNDGEVTLTDRIYPLEHSVGIEVYSLNGNGKVKSLSIWKLDSVWK